MNFYKKLLSFVLVITTITTTILAANTGSSTVTAASTDATVGEISYWSGSAAKGFASGDGTKENPYIIATADQLYYALTLITDSTNTVAGGKQTSQILKQGSTTEYVPVYTPYYYKIADGVKAIYLNDITGKESLSGIKSFVTTSSKLDWKPGKSFVGYLDGNGVTIYGMYSSTGQGLVYKLDGSSVVKNFNFDSCYSRSSNGGNAAMVTTLLGTYNNDTTIITIANISVRNSYIATTRNISVTQRSDNSYYQHSSGASGIVSTQSTCESLTIANCLYDGHTCERTIGSNSEITVDMIGGIISGGANMNNVTVSSSVALDAPITDEVYVNGKEVFYNRYDKNLGYPVYFYHCYSNMATTLPAKYPNKYDKLLDIKRLNVQESYTERDMPELNWLKSWQLVNVTDTRAIPMPRTNKTFNDVMLSYSLEISNQNNGGGAYSIFGGAYYSGTYGMYHELVGAGTQDDPYIINNAFELARAIASGGMNVYSQLYYKLACDINASDALWISQEDVVKTGSTKYKYIPFNGILDGDGHTVSGICAGADESIGLIPVLAENGIVKNIHMRNSYVGSGEEYAGAIVGEAQDGAQIIGCSVEDCVVISRKADNHIAGRIKDTAIKNSYYIAGQRSTVSAKTGYFQENGATEQVNVADNQDVWYLGGRDGSTPKLKNAAVAQKLTDIDGDGMAVEYTARDLAALRQHLLLEEDYQHIYADVDRNGKTDVLDLVVLCNEMIGDFSNPNNDFWRNVNLGRVNIYYGENDSYDAARKLELYLESKVPDVDIKKFVSADKTVYGDNSDKDAVYVHSNDSVGIPSGMMEIIVGDIKNYSIYAKNSLDINDYAITYDTTNGVLWFKGGSFTGVEQAVLDFISNSKVETGEIYTVDRATLSKEKHAQEVYVDSNYDGKADTYIPMFYAWGDEFDGNKTAASGENDELSTDTWNHSKMRTETENGKSGNYNNVESVNEKELSNLYWVENGRLSITRGVKAEHATQVTDNLGYVRLYNQTGTTAFGDEIDDEDIIGNPGLIKTNHSMLYKQGYAEMYGSLPSDGHTFASWWMLGHSSMNNYAIGESLYGKIYKLNNTGEYAYDGTSTWPVSTDPKTYKYQMPTNYFEIDIWELMQHPERVHSTLQKTRTTGAYDYRIWLNVHKFYSVGARNQAIVNVIDWDNPGTPRAVMKKEWFGTPADDYYFSASPNYLDFTDGKTTRMTKDWLGRTTANYAEALQKQFTAPRRYGFYWSTNGVDKFNFTLYIYDINGDGIEGDDAILGTNDITYNTQDKMNPQDYDCVSDAEVANQYMYFLFDNILYTSNSKHSNSTAENAVMHTDMLTDEGTAANPDKIDLEIDYVRVYQYDGRRDIITRETEDFNNGNHFGY